jgi:hypothetical protein
VGRDRHRVAQHLSIIGHEHEVAAPGIDADALHRDVALVCQSQSVDDFVVECKDIPVEMPRGLDEMIVKASKLLQPYLAPRQCSDDGSSTGSSQVDGKEVSLLVHRKVISIIVLSWRKVTLK